MNTKRITIVLVIIAILIRMVFVYRTTVSQIQYDFGIIDLSNLENYDKLYTDFDKGNLEGRHINYIMHIYKYWTLPEKIVGEFYHPPLHHFLMAVWLRCMDFISNDNVFKLESMQIVSLIDSIIIIITFILLLKELDIKNKIVPLSLLCFYPLYIYLSGTLNNDQPVAMLELICLLYLIKWRKDQSYKNTIIGAFVIGLGAMTKSSMFVMIIPAIFVFFEVLTKYVNSNKNIKKLLIEMVMLCLIVVPLSFWYHIYRGGESLGIITPFEHFSLRDKTIYERFGILNLFEVKDYNIWNATLLTSIDFIGTHSNIIVKILIGLDLLLIFNWIYLFIKSKKDSLLVLCNIVWWLSYIFFFISMPYVPTINARYVVIPLIISYLDIGKGLDNIENKLVKYEVYSLITIISVLSVIICFSLT